MISYFNHVNINDRSDWPGTYGSVLLTNKSCARLYDYLSPYVADLEPPEKYHITTIYTKNILPLTSQRLLINLSSEYFKYEKFSDTLLVLRVEHSILHHLFEKAIRLGATWDFPSYKPHITLSTNFPSDISNLPDPPDFWLYTTEHRIEPLKDD